MSNMMYKRQFTSLRCLSLLALVVAVYIVASYLKLTELMKNYSSAQVQEMQMPSIDKSDMQSLEDKLEQVMLNNKKGVNEWMEQIRFLAKQTNQLKEIVLNSAKQVGKVLKGQKQSDNKRIFYEKNLQQEDDNSTAVSLYNKVRILCWVPISDDTLNTSGNQVLQTWGKQCNKLIFFTNKDHQDFPTVGLGIPDSGSYNLTFKVFKSLSYIAEHYVNEYEWAIKADTDTFLILENLRYMLSDHDPSKPLFFGHHFKNLVANGYMSGGAGYVLSREAIARFGKQPCVFISGTEDLEMGKCMQSLGVIAGDSRDKNGNSRFHCLRPNSHVAGNVPYWYNEYSKYGAEKGVSDYAISFHGVRAQDMMTMEFFIYHLRPYGILAGLRNLNGPVQSNMTAIRHIKFINKIQ